MTQRTDPSLPSEIRRVIDNGFYSHHPFKGNSGQLEDFVSIFDEMKALDQASFRNCLGVIQDLVEKNVGCADCHGKGLAYLKLLTSERDNETRNVAAERYETFANTNARTRSSNFEAEVREIMHTQGVRSIPTHTHSNETAKSEQASEMGKNFRSKI